MTSNQLTRSDRRIARPLKVLVPVIKKDLSDRKSVRDNASAELDVRIGEELIEAKSQLRHGEWGDWLSENFHLSQSSANLFMRMATAQNGAGAPFSSQAEFRRATQPSFNGPAWREPVQDVLKRVRVESFNLRQRDISQNKERDLERKLALQLIDIGYKVLSVKLHPDKGGSHEAMQRLNRVRSRLKEAA